MSNNLCRLACALAVACGVFFPRGDGHGQTEALLVRADSLRSRGELRAAQQLYEKVLKADKSSLEARVGLGKVAVAKEDWGEAIDHFGAVLERAPDNLEAHYYRGICYRESGKFKALLLRKLDWNKAEKHFKEVLARDSLFQDVLYQYAVLCRYRGRYMEAIQAAHDQLRLRPELVEPQVKIFRLYRYLISHTGTDTALSWLAEQPWEHARYCRAEALRRAGNLSVADSLLQSLLLEPLNMPRQPIYLSLARVYYERGQTTQGERFFWRAVEEIAGKVEADLVFEDVKYVLNDQELVLYRSLEAPDSLKAFFRVVWTERNPTPAAETNCRLAEHYRRLLFAEKNYEYDGFRTRFNNPDKLSRLQFSKISQLNEEFNDKGLIYIRHGEPDERAVTLGQDVEANESWLYYQTPFNPRMTFHFMLENSPTAWRLAPYIDNPRMLEDRLTWGGEYARLLRADQLERLSLVEQMAQQSQKAVAVALSTDRHTWAKAIQPLEVPFLLAAFRGEQGGPRLELCFAVPLRQLAQRAAQEMRLVHIDHGVAVFDRALRPVSQERKTVEVDPHRSTAAYLELLQFHLPAGTYNIGFHVQVRELNMLGGFKLQRTVEEFSEGSLNMSDLLLASRISAAMRPSSFVRQDLEVIPNPTHTFSLQQPVYVYFEIYGLTRDQSGHTAYVLEYRLDPVKQGKKGAGSGFGLFGGGEKPSLSIRAQREGDGEFAAEHVAIDASKVPKGQYRLTVKVSDRQSGQTKERSVDVRLL
ncbi:MAG: GWxTD domain-containing protein [candidate division KSB1 bacterium]|nr:GWxTD domain-containing protein [candidate division KSB1 bacterium]